jgi:alkylated DNA repair dioxygenase AlkB
MARQYAFMDLLTEPSWPRGFAYREALFSASEERKLVGIFETLPLKPFEFHGYRGNRRIASFGWRYDYGARHLRVADPIPAFLRPLLELAAQFGGLDPKEICTALVTEYAPGAGIGWHRDKPMFRDVLALSFLAPCVLRLRRKQDDDWIRQSIAIRPRSGYRLSADVRELWEHSITPMTALRYSVTFRTFKPGHAGATRSGAIGMDE